MMKFTFAVACMLAACNAEDPTTGDKPGKPDKPDKEMRDEVMLADDNGINGLVLNWDTGKTGEEAFRRDWNVPSEFGVAQDPEDKQGFEMDATYYTDTAWLNVPDPRDPKLFEGKDMLVFRVIILGQWPNYDDEFEVRLTATINGEVKSTESKGKATDKE